LVEKTINIIKWSKAKAFLIENVENFLTVKKGIMLERFKEMFPDFGITAKVIDSAQLGSAQKRRRAFIIGLQGAVPELELPHLSEYRTVKQAFEAIDQAPQQDMHFHPTPKTLERMKWVPQGGNILDVPEELRAPNKKFSNYCQRLMANGQCPTITHVNDEVFIHQSEDR
jgi:DNA (cytosine-5)-methyltransferase 1